MCRTKKNWSGPSNTFFLHRFASEPLLQRHFFGPDFIQNAFFPVSGQKIRKDLCSGRYFFKLLCTFGSTEPVRTLQSFTKPGFQQIE